MKKALGLLVLSGCISLGTETAARAHGAVSEEMAPLKPGRVISVMTSDFLVPDGFRFLPGPIFYLNHTKELDLTPRQKDKIMAIARVIMPETVRDGRAIDRMKHQAVHLSDGRVPFQKKRLRTLLLEIGKREAMAELAHLTAHRACLHMLTPAQRARLFALLGHP